jgi:hypothetical protein
MPKEEGGCKEHNSTSKSNNSRYAWREENYEENEKEMGALCFTRRVHKREYPKDSSYRTIKKNMMVHKNQLYGCQTTCKQYKYSGEQEQRQQVCSYTSPAQHGPG